MPRFRIDSSERIAEIVFDDGGMNLLSSAALRELGEAVDALPDVDVLVFRSGRERLFAAGADMAEMRTFDGPAAEAFAELGQTLFARIERLPMITVALIDGDCFGGALDLAFAFDLRFATPRSRFSHPGAKLGIVTGFGGTSRWRHVITPAVARQLFLGNVVFSAQDALESGLVDRVADDHAAEIARLATLDPEPVKTLKAMTR